MCAHTAVLVVGLSGLVTYLYYRRCVCNASDVSNTPDDVSNTHDDVSNTHDVEVRIQVETYSGNAVARMHNKGVICNQVEVQIQVETYSGNVVARMQNKGNMTYDEVACRVAKNMGAHPCMVVLFDVANQVPLDKDFVFCKDAKLLACVRPTFPDHVLALTCLNMQKQPPIPKFIDEEGFLSVAKSRGTLHQHQVDCNDFCIAPNGERRCSLTKIGDFVHSICADEFFTLHIASRNWSCASEQTGDVYRLTFANDFPLMSAIMTNIILTCRTQPNFCTITFRLVDSTVRHALISDTFKWCSNNAKPLMFESGYVMEYD